MKYYSLENILKEEAQYYIIFGERSNGKSYAVDKYAIDNYFNKSEEFVIVKRYQDDVKKSIAETMLTPLYDYVLEKYNHYIRFYQGKWLCSKDKDLPISQWNVMGYAQALNNVDRYKGSQYPKVTTIIFEEFMSMKGEYLPNEINMLMNIVSTIARKRTNVKVFMLGNTISKYSPYSEALDIKLDKIKVGQIITKETKYKNSITKFVIERTRNVKVNGNKENGITYTNFGNKKSKMINGGQFETNNYSRMREGVYFIENKKELEQEGIKLNKKDKFNSNNRTNIVIEYNGNYYDIYMKLKKQIVVGIKLKEQQQITNKVIAVINPSKDYNVINIFNLRTVLTRSNVINNMLDQLVKAMLNNYVIFPTDEIGEDVTTALKLVGME